MAEKCVFNLPEALVDIVSEVSVVLLPPQRSISTLIAILFL